MGQENKKKRFSAYFAVVVIPFSSMAALERRKVKQRKESVDILES